LEEVLTVANPGVATYVEQGFKGDGARGSLATPFGNVGKELSEPMRVARSDWLNCLLIFLLKLKASLSFIQIKCNADEFEMSSLKVE
jgi:hypothetical protein